jgi:hypothetical protein
MPFSFSILLTTFALGSACYLALILAVHAALEKSCEDLAEDEHEMWEDLEWIDSEKQLREGKVDVIWGVDSEESE